ncbi:hypothetical protein C2845_PM10G11420 [Panicum miliaceum]|uniref:Uncharacterized protein n=1 Tax=Panicum miliaceum TaxID=4540 RepID=A0A3L6PGQ7_PANMI|nr:hypothetical protein C2845_PM10G11420 [Panicum miliaceum]
MQSYPLVKERIRNLGETPRVDVEDTEDRLAFVAMLRKVSKVFSTRDLTQEYIACRCWPLKASWSIKALFPEAQWTGGIPVLDFDENSVESWADEILGAESFGEYKAILQKLGGTRTNRVFRAFEIEAPPSITATRHQAAKEKWKLKKETQEMKAVGGAPVTAQLEQKKRKLGAKAGGPSKRTRVVDILFGASSPLTAKENVEDALSTPPLSSVPPPPSQPRVSSSGSSPLPGLDVSDQETESNEQVDILGSPSGDAKTRDLVAAGKLSPSKSQSSLGGSSSSFSSSGESGKRASSAGDDDHERSVRGVAKSVHSSSSNSESNGYFVSSEDPV